MKLIARLLLTTLALLVVAAYVPGVAIDGLYSAIMAAVVLGLLNLFVRPILVILTFPITLLTLGLFILIINASLFWFAATFIEGFSVTGFLPALIGSLIVTIVSTLGNKYLD
jgi:putative membrane protein